MLVHCRVPPSIMSPVPIYTPGYHSEGQPRSTRSEFLSRGVYGNCRLSPIWRVVKSAYTSQVAHQARAYPSFRGMKRLGIFLLPPGWDELNSPVPIYTPGWREAPWESSVLPKDTTQCPRPGLEPGVLAPESSALTMRPPSLLNQQDKFVFIYLTC